MKKLTKGAVAAGAGVVLLLGSAGTLALWNDSAGMVGDEITSGVMTISAEDPGSWDATVPAVWVPGDTATWEQEFTIEASGDNLEAELTAVVGDVTGDPELADELEVEIQSVTGVTGTGVSITGPASPGDPWVVVPTGTGGTVTATALVTVTFPDSVGGTTAQDDTVELGDILLSLVQVRN